MQFGRFGHEGSKHSEGKVQNESILKLLYGSIQAVHHPRPEA